jgi:hypothetical protein
LTVLQVPNPVVEIVMNATGRGPVRGIPQGTEGSRLPLEGTVTVIGTAKIRTGLEASASGRIHGESGMTFDGNESGMLTERLSSRILDDGETTGNERRGWLQDGGIGIQINIVTKSEGGIKIRHGIQQPNVDGCPSRTATGVRNAQLDVKRGMGQTQTIRRNGKTVETVNEIEKGRKNPRGWIRTFRLLPAGIF